MTRTHLKKTAPLAWDRELGRRLREALAEDLGSGDVTTEPLVPRGLKARGRLIAKDRGILCGAPVAERIWRLLSRSVRIDWLKPEGARVRPGNLVARLEGPYWALLEGERVALNFLARLSAVATLTSLFVRAAGGSRGPAICDTRKTTPLWRKLERYAVRTGGGVNHRFGLSDMVLIKENHIRAAGGIAAALRKARAANPRLKIGAEARTAAEVGEAAAERADLILLDNMTPARVRDVVQKHRAPGLVFEVSGGVGLSNVRAFARSGVDRISIGAITHSAPALDLSLQLYPTSKAR